MNWEESVRKWSWPNFTWYPEICVKELLKSTLSLYRMSTTPTSKNMQSFVNCSSTQNHYSNFPFSFRNTSWPLYLNWSLSLFITKYFFRHYISLKMAQSCSLKISAIWERIWEFTPPFITAPWWNRFATGTWKLLRTRSSFFLTLLTNLKEAYTSATQQLHKQ